MPALRGTEPTSSAHEVPSKAVLRSDGRHDVGQQREGAVVELHDDALEHLQRRLDLEQAQHDGLVGAEQLARGDAEQERVADLAGGAGDGDVDGGLAAMESTVSSACSGLRAAGRGGGAAVKAADQSGRRWRRRTPST